MVSEVPSSVLKPPTLLRNKIGKSLVSDPGEGEGDFRGLNLRGIVVTVLQVEREGRAVVEAVEVPAEVCVLAGD